MASVLPATVDDAWAPMVRQPAHRKPHSRAPAHAVVVSSNHHTARAFERPRTHDVTSGRGAFGVGEVTMAQAAVVDGAGDEDEEPPRSERVSVALGWELEATGAGNVDERTWMYLSDGRSVRVMWIDDDGRSCTRLIPNAVLAHVLRAQGYAVEERMVAG